MNGDTVMLASATIGGGFVGGLLLGYALKKVLKLIAIIVGLFITGLAYLQYQQLATFNWDRIEGTISTIANATTNVPKFLKEFNTKVFTSQRTAFI